MTKKEKLLHKIRQNPRNVSLHDFERLINTYGHIESGGKHPKAILPGHYPMPYKRENPVKSCYVQELLGIIDSL